MIVIYDHWIPKLIGAQGITLYPYILVSFPFQKTYQMDEIIAHEFVHVEQIKGHGFLEFYLGYLWQYLKGRGRGLSHNQAYLEISFEKEAYRAQNTSRFRQMAYEYRLERLKEA